ncbi:MAG: hypothetical protein ACYSWX_13505, partial [Planctomycetota bacterium]
VEPMDMRLEGPLDGPLDCGTVRHLIPLHVGQDLEDQAGRLVDEHLVGCDACAAELARAEEARQVYFEAGNREAGVDLWPGVRAGLIAAGQLEGDARPSLRPEPMAPFTSRPSGVASVAPIRRLWVASAAAAAMLLTAVAAIQLAPGGGTGSEEMHTGPEIASETPTVAPAVGVAQSDEAPSQGGLRSIPESERLLQPGRPLLVIPQGVPGATGGNESLASGRLR